MSCLFGDGKQMTQNSPLVSIIVPVYNSRKYLSECCDSLLRQDYPNVDVILVDDGSDDGSERICEEYAALDSRVRVIHQSNAGHVRARSVGLRHADGDIVMWMDSDDWADAHWVTSYLDRMDQSGADMVISGNKDALLRNPASMVSFLLARADHTLWASCARRDLYQGLEFANVTIGEDVLMLQQLISRAEKLCIIQGELGYHYREVPDSISRKQTLGNKKDWLMRASMEVFFAKEHDSKLVKCAYFDVMRGATIIYKSIQGMSIKDDEQAETLNLEQALRKLMLRGIMHQPIRYMHGAEYVTVLKTIKTLILCK